MGNLSHNNDLAEELNSQFVEAVLPVTVFVGIEACVGFLGNVLVLYVFSFKYHKCNFKYFVLFLALIDLTSCLTTIPGEMVTQSFWYTYPVPMVCKAKSFFNVFTVCASALCLLLIAIDRYRKVCKPFGWQVKSEIAIYLCICALFIAGIVATPVAILWGEKRDKVAYKNFTVNVTSCEKDEKYKNTKHPIIYSSTTGVIITIPMVVMAVLYFLIVRQIRVSMHKTRARGSIAADSVEMSVTVLHAGKMNYDGTDDQRSEDKNSKMSITEVDDEGEDQKGYPNKRSEDMLPNPVRRNTEVKKVMDNNTIDILDPKGDDSIKVYKSKHAKTKENDKERSVSTSSNDIRMNVSDGKKKISSGQLNHPIKRKTLIMFILSAVFFITTILYLSLLSLIADEENILMNLTSSQKTIYFFFFRLYFIHHVINPFVYAFLDSHFKMTLREMAWKIRNITSSFMVANKT